MAASNKTVRMSADEKRRAILGVYHRTKEVYTEKEIIALATKAGVNQNTIADINQALCDDGLVNKDKIGGSNYYWSFPAKNDRLLQLEHDDTLLKINELRSSMKDAEVRLADAKRGREEEEEEEDAENGGDGDGNEEGRGRKNETRASKMARRVTLLAELAKAQIELEKLKQNDPREIANLEKELTLVTDAANRWTDNIFSCKDYLVKKRGMMKAEANKYLGITDAFDYPEDKMAKKK